MMLFRRSIVAPRRRLVSLLASIMALGGIAPAMADPDLGWGTPFELDRLPIIPALPGAEGEVAVGPDGTRWVYYRELATTGQIVKPEALVFFYRRAADPDWSSLEYTGVGGNTSPLVDRIGGGPVLAVLDDGRALLAYRRITFGGIHVLLVDPALDETRVDFIRSSDDCPFARNPQIAAAGDTAMVTWLCSPTVDGRIQNRAEAAYFDGSIWSEPEIIPGVDEVGRLAGDTATGRFLTIGNHYLDADGVLVTARAVASTFDPVMAWTNEPEVLLEIDAGFQFSASVSGQDIVIAEDGSALAVWTGGADDNFGLWAAYRNPQGEWSPAHVLVPEVGGESGSAARVATAAGRFAVTWSSLLEESGSDDPFGPIDLEGPAPEVLARGVKGAIRLADGNWTVPADLFTEDGDTGNSFLARLVVFPNGSFSAIWAEPVGEDANALIRSATVPTGASCWRPTVTLDGPRRVLAAQVNIAPDLDGGFLASWLRTILGEPFGTTLALVADGPDGSGGSADCPLVAVEPDPDPDTTPDAFSFTSVTGATPGSAVESAAITVQGIDAAAAISITGGQYSVDGGAFTSASGTVENGQTVVLRITAASGNAATNTATLTIGGISAGFSVTTVAAVNDDDNDNDSGNSGGSSALDPLMLLLLALVAGAPGVARRGQTGCRRR